MKYSTSSSSIESASSAAAFKEQQHAEAGKKFEPNHKKSPCEVYMERFTAFEEEHGYTMPILLQANCRAAAQRPTAPPTAGGAK